MLLFGCTDFTIKHSEGLNCFDSESTSTLSTGLGDQIGMCTLPNQIPNYTIDHVMRFTMISPPFCLLQANQKLESGNEAKVYDKLS